MASRRLSADDDAAAECALLGGLFAYAIQFLLGLAAVGSLVFKRQYLERPQRPWRVWGFDVGKQLVGGGFVHFANIAVSALLSNAGGDQCAWYFLNFFADCTLGVAIVAVVHEGLCRAAVHRHGARSALARVGVYGSPPGDRVRWATQLAAYLAALLVNKVIVAGLLYAGSAPLARFGDWLFGPLQPHPNVELAVVMVLCPWLLTSFQFWVFDALLKAKEPLGPRTAGGDGFVLAEGAFSDGALAQEPYGHVHGPFHSSPDDEGP